MPRTTRRSECRPIFQCRLPGAQAGPVAATISETCSRLYMALLPDPRSPGSKHRRHGNLSTVKLSLPSTPCCTGSIMRSTPASRALLHLQCPSATDLSVSATFRGPKHRKVFARASLTFPTAHERLIDCTIRARADREAIDLNGLSAGAHTR